MRRVPVDMSGIGTRRVPGAARAVVAAVAVCGALTAPAQAGTTATITPSFSPNRLGARSALTFTIHYAGGGLGVPAPVRQSILRFPAGLGLNIPHLRSCAAADLQNRGPIGCPVQSKIGSGHALTTMRVGSQIIAEDVVLSAFLGPLENLQPTVEIFGEGIRPTAGWIVLTGTVLPDRAPYGEELVILVPPISTVPEQPDASIVTFSLTIGASKRQRARNANTVLVPSRCPAGGFPFAAEFTYADSSRGSAVARTPCPR